MKKTVIEKSCRIPIRDNYDVVVIGGGIAGVSAAVSAARNKTRVCIIEKMGMLGGLATAGLIGFYLPLCDGTGKKVASGIAEELLKLSVEFEPQKIPLVWRTDKSSINKKWEARYTVSFNPNFFSLSLDKWIKKNKVAVFFETLFVNAIYEKRLIKYIICEDIAGRYAISTNFVIDASGSSVVAAKCNVPTITSPNVIASWFYTLEADNVIIEKDILLEQMYRLQTTGGHVDRRHWSKNAEVFSGIKPKDITNFHFKSRALMYETIKKKKNAIPVTLPTMAQFRNIRRLKGDFMLDEKHVGRCFPDAIGMIGDWRRKGPVYQIPFRSLISKKISNLLMVGRNVSATNSGIEVLRAIPACAVTGQAAGVAASISVKKNISVSNIDVSKLQKRLIKQGVIIE